MKTLFLLLSLLVVPGAVFAADIASVGPGPGVLVPGPDTNPCPGSALFLNDDGSFENGYAWQYGGVAPPDLGAFAEGYGFGGLGFVCGVQLKLTQVGNFQDQSLDVFIWDSDGTNPSNVLAVLAGTHISAPGFWPDITAHDIDTPDAATHGLFFVGYWANWPNAPCGWYVAADLDGFGGMPRTRVAGGIGYPTGWQDPSIIWGPTQALGLGPWGGLEPIPVERATWGRIKSLYR